MYKIDFKEFRRKNNFTQKQLASYLGTGQGFVSQMETGKNPTPEKYIIKILEDPDVDSSMVVVESPDTEVKMSREVFNRMSQLIDTVCSQQGTIASQQDLLAKMQCVVYKAITPPHLRADSMDGADSEGNKGDSAVG